MSGNEEKAKLYERYMYDYDKISNEIGVIKMNNFDLTKKDTDKIKILEQKLSIIRSRVEMLG